MNCVLLYWRLLPVRLLYNDFGESWCWLSERNYHDELLLASPDRNFSSGSSGSVGILNSGGLILLFFLFWFWSKRWLHCPVQKTKKVAVLFVCFLHKKISILPENDSWFFRFLVKVTKIRKNQLSFSDKMLVVTLTKKRKMEWTRQKWDLCEILKNQDKIRIKSG